MMLLINLDGESLKKRQRERNSLDLYSLPKFLCALNDFFFFYPSRCAFLTTFELIVLSFDFRNHFYFHMFVSFGNR